MTLLALFKKRSGLPTNYKLPEIKIHPNFAASYIYVHKEETPTGQHTELVVSDIIIGKDVINRLASQEPEVTYYGTQKLTKLNKKQRSNFTVRIGTATQIARAVGVEEGAHSVYVRDSLNKNRPITTSRMEGKNLQQKLSNYHTSKIEYHGLGWQIRTLLDQVEAGTLSPEQADLQLAPLRNLISRVIKLKIKHNQAE